MDEIEEGLLEGKMLNKKVEAKSRGRRPKPTPIRYGQGNARDLFITRSQYPWCIILIELITLSQA